MATRMVTPGRVAGAKPIKEPTNCDLEYWPFASIFCAVPVLPADVYPPDTARLPVATVNHRGENLAHHFCGSRTDYSVATGGRQENRVESREKRRVGREAETRFHRWQWPNMRLPSGPGLHLLPVPWTSRRSRFPTSVWGASTVRVLRRATPHQFSPQNHRLAYSGKNAFP